MDMKQDRSNSRMNPRDQNDIKGRNQQGANADESGSALSVEASLDESGQQAGGDESSRELYRDNDREYFGATARSQEAGDGASPGGSQQFDAEDQESDSRAQTSFKGASEGNGEAAEKWNELREKMMRKARQVDSYIHSKPYAYVLGALGLGLAVGRMWQNPRTTPPLKESDRSHA